MGKDDSTQPILPNVGDRILLTLCDAPHPAVLPPEQLLQVCELRTQRRSGPGGQHRNKTSSGVFLTHRPSGIVGEATERRSQAANRTVALQRLRFRLAVHLRTPSIFDASEVPLESDVRAAYFGKSLKLNDQNDAKPGVLAMVLNDLHASGGQPSAVAEKWSASTSAIVGLIKSDRDAFAIVNRIRQHHGRRALK
ncbi:peptide chain release factor family protein [Stieleria marina]|uniref:peptide chain release factor family protein n=1 Tax=Stieleria marina TaxID=1930275 RepID=UPI003AF34FA7